MVKKPKRIKARKNLKHAKASQPSKSSTTNNRKQSLRNLNEHSLESKQTILSSNNHKEHHTISHTKTNNAPDDVLKSIKEIDTRPRKNIEIPICDPVDNSNSTLTDSNLGVNVSKTGVSYGRRLLPSERVQMKREQVQSVNQPVYTAQSSLNREQFFLNAFNNQSNQQLVNNRAVANVLNGQAPVYNMNPYQANQCSPQVPSTYPYSLQTSSNQYPSFIPMAMNLYHSPPPPQFTSDSSAPRSPFQAYRYSYPPSFPQQQIPSQPAQSLNPDVCPSIDSISETSDKPRSEPDINSPTSDSP